MLSLSLRRQPLVVFLIIFISGIFFANRIRINFFFLYFLAWVFLAISLILLKKGLSFDIFIIAVIFFFATGLLINAKCLPSCHILKYVLNKNSRPYIIKGYIDSEPEFADNRLRFIIQTEGVKSAGHNYRCCGKVLVYLKSKKDLRYGQGLILKGNLYPPFRFGVDRHKIYRNYLYRQGIRLLMSVKSDSDTIILKANKGNPFKIFAFRLKRIIKHKIYSFLPKNTAAVLEAMILGERSNIPRYIYNAMMKSGTVHILVVSGFNVGIVMLVATLVLKLLRVARNFKFYIIIPVLIIYCFITGASAPVVRATIMASVFIFAKLMRRQSDIYNSLSIAALSILINNPWQLFDIGFQLSFASVFSIAYIYPKIKSLLPLFLFKIKYLRPLLEAGLVSLSAWLGTMGFIAYYFHFFSPVTVLANIFIVPLATLITLSGFTLVTIGSFFSFIAPYLAASCEFFIRILINLNALFIKLPGAYFSLPPKFS